jgi:hypothetical protein
MKPNKVIAVLFLLPFAVIGCTTSKTAPGGGSAVTPTMTAAGSSQSSSGSAPTPKVRRSCSDPVFKVIPWSQVSNQPPTARLVDNLDSSCFGEANYEFGRAPDAAGDCTEMAALSDYPNYDVKAKPAPPLPPGIVIVFKGTACGLANSAHPDISQTR